MSTYAVGDIQGCLKPLQCLLDQVAFDPRTDRLWLAGDMVNRGPDSLATLRFLYGLGDAVTAVLGNHDLHLLAIAHGYQSLRKNDTVQDILQAPDRSLLLDWLLHRPLFHHDKNLGYSLVHAGLHPHWSVEKTQSLAQEVESVLQGKHANNYFANMYGDQPDHWSEALTGYERLRVITNYLTRVRFITASGALDLKNKLEPENAAFGTIPWFSHPQRKTRNDKVIFGHWAALQGRVDEANLFALDTGCVWGGKLTLLRLEDKTFFSCDCSTD